MLTCHEPQHTTCFIVWSWNHIAYLQDKNCYLPMILNPFDCANGYNVLAMQGSCVSIPFILATRCGFTMMTLLTLKSPWICGKRSKYWKNRHLEWNFEKKHCWIILFWNNNQHCMLSRNYSMFYRKFGCGRQILWFQQDGAILHTVAPTMNFLR